MFMNEGSRRSAPPRTDQVISDERFARYHAYARERGVNLVLYLIARALLVPALLIWLRLSRTGREHLRGIRGGLIVASNHRSFLDPFVIGATLPWRRPMQYVAKVELFERPWQGWILSRLGGFPPLRKAAVIGAGSWGTAVAVLLARGGLEVQLGTRSRERAAEIEAERENPQYLPGIRLPEAIVVKRAPDIELAGVDLVCL